MHRSNELQGSIIDIPEYSSDAYLNFDIIYDYYVDILIYIEDTSKLFIYEVIFRRMLGNRIKYENIIPTGGKPKLLELHQLSQKQTTKPCLFIADMDFDFILFENSLVRSNNFLYLKRYSIENYLVDHLSGASFVNGRTDIGLENCKSRIDFNQWIKALQYDYRQLLIMFMLVQKLGLGIPNTVQKAEFFIKDNSWQMDRKKILKYYQLIKDFTKAKNTLKIKEAIKIIKRDLDHLYKEDSWRLLPGKQLLRIFQRYLLEHSDRGTISDRDFINILVANCDLSELDYIKSKVEELVSVVDSDANNATAG
ncbi:DUF4435 domain-containing protein [Paenibacillus sp. FSL H8-0280]|uniref:DUF4435 domain-containing protein n=1 Tax=Paenibacillus sp. FSL H8-0280 TaxID=2921382 RepID=UPI0032543E5B